MNRTFERKLSCYLQFLYLETTRSIILHSPVGRGPAEVPYTVDLDIGQLAESPAVTFIKLSQSFSSFPHNLLVVGEAGQDERSVEVDGGDVDVYLAVREEELQQLAVVVDGGHVKSGITGLSHQQSIVTI